MNMSSYKRNLNIGLAGEYMVASVMSIKGWDASLTLKNYPAADIFGYNPECDMHVRIQVKTTIAQSSYMTGFKLPSTANEDDVSALINGPYVFVYYKNSKKETTCILPRFFILSKQDMIKIVIKENSDYFSKPRNVAVKEVQPLAIKVKNLEDYENRWENLWVV